MRVGLVAKGLLLKGDKDLELVLLCSNKPTVTLIEQVTEKLTEQLEVEMSAVNVWAVWCLSLYENVFSHSFLNSCSEGDTVGEFFSVPLCHPDPCLSF